MNRVSKAILIALAGLLTLAAFAVVAINLYVQSPGTQARIQAELSEALRLPLTITNTSITPWSDLRINGITVPAEAGDFLQASSFTARYKLLPLLQKRLVVYDMRVEQPKIVWRQNRDGKWVLPALAKAAANAAEEKERDKAEDDTSEEFQVLLDGFKITGGSMELLDAEEKRVALLTDVNMDYTVLTADRVEGTMNIGRAEYAETIVLENVRSPFTYASGEFTLPALEAMLAGGALRGSFHLASDVPDAPFTASLALDKADVTRLERETRWGSGQDSGTLSGKLDLRGSSRAPALAEGRGELTLHEGQVRELELFRAIGVVLQFEQLANLRIKTGRADFRVADEKIFVEGLTLEAPDVQASAKGVIRFDQKVVLDAQLGVKEHVAARIPNVVRDFFPEPGPNGEVVVTFKITGKTDRLKSDLAEKLVGKRIGDQLENIVSTLRGFLGKKDDKKEEKKKKKKEPKLPPQGVPPVVPSNGLPPPSPAGRPAPSTAPPLDAPPAPLPAPEP